MRIERQKLLDALKLVKPAVASSDIIEELSHVWFTGTDLIASNDKGFGIRVPFKCGIQGGIRGNLLYDVLSFSRAKEIDFEEEEKGFLIKAGRARLHLAILDIKKLIAEVPDIKSLERVHKLNIDFFSALGKILIAKGDPMSIIPELAGITFIKTEVLNLFATDSKAIAHATCKLLENWKPKRISVPLIFAEQLLKMGTSVYLSLEKDQIIAKSDSMLIFSRLLQSEAEEKDLLLIVNDNISKAKGFPIPSRLKLALARSVAMISGAKDTGVEFKVDGEVLRLEASTPLGSLKDSIPLESKPSPVTTLLDPGMLLKGLPLCNTIALSKGAAVLQSKGFNYLVAGFG